MMQEVSQKVSEDTAAPQGTTPTVGSVVQAIAVLRHLSSLDEGMGVTAIASRLSISPSSCFNILKTLVAEEFLEFDKRRKTYRLGIGAIDLARHAAGASNVFPGLRERLQELSERFDITVGLWRMANRKRFVLIGVGENPQATRIHMAVGQRVPLLAGAIGRCAAAASQMSDDDIARELELVRWQSRPPLSDYLRQIDAVRRIGWAIDAGQWRRGVTTVGAPIVDSDDALQFCITGSMFTDQHDHHTVQSICEEVSAAAQYAAQRAYGREVSKRVAG